MTRRLPRPSVAVRIARVEMVRDLRAILDNSTQVVVLAVSGLLFAAVTLGGAVAAYAFGTALRTGGGPPAATVRSFVRGGAGIAWIGLTGFVAARTAGQGVDIDRPAGLLTAAPVADAVAGAVLSELAWACIVGGSPAVLVVGAFAAGARAPLAVVVIPAVALAAAASAFTVGFVIGTAVRHLITRYEPLARHTTTVGAALFVAWIAFAVSGGIDRVVVGLYGPVRRSPLGWLGDAVLLAVPGVAASPLRSGTAVAGSVVLAVLGLAASVRIAERYWLSDPPTSDEAATVEGGDRRLDRLLAGMVARPTRAVATATQTRARRAPIQLVYVLYPLFAAGVVVQDALEKGYVPAYAPPALSVYATWAVGAAFTLNPLGTQGSTLPAVLTADVSGRSFVRGHVLAGCVVGAPLAALLVGAAAVASPASVATAAGLAAVTAAGAVVAAALAVGIGTVFPRFGTVNVTNNREAVVPSKTAAAVYSLSWLVVAGLASVLLSPSTAGAVADAVGIGRTAVRIAFGFGLFVVLSGPYLSYRHAVRRADRYRLE